MMDPGHCGRCQKPGITRRLCDHCVWVITAERHIDALRDKRPPIPHDLAAFFEQVFGFDVGER
jgi:hypothetical protein